MQFFFECIQYYTLNFDSTTDYSLVMDRLYKRYLRLEELDPVLSLIKKIRSVFAKIEVPTDFIEGQKDHENNMFNLKVLNLEDFFDKHLRVVESAITNAKEMYEIYKKRGQDFYQKVMITGAHPVYSTIDEDRPEEMYDKLTQDQQPYWLLAEPVKDY